jgi:hypothetical protein
MSVGNTRQQPTEAAGIKLIIYWLIAGIPLLWGVANTIGDATKLFR